MILFKYPMIFIAAMILPVAYFIVLLKWTEKSYAKRYRFYNPLISYAKPITRDHRYRRIKEYVLVAVAIFLVLSALAGPYIVVTEYRTVNLVQQENLRIKAKPAVVLIIDTSGSMQGEKIEEAKKALVEFVRIIDGKADIGLISFASTVKSALPPTSNTSMVVEEIEKLQAGGGTMYQYPLITALDWLRTYRYFNLSAYVVFASDGLPADLSVAEKIVKQYASLGIPIYTIFIGRTERGYNVLKHIAEETHAKCFQAKNAAEILEKYIEAARQVKTSIVRSVNVTITTNIKIQRKIDLSMYLYLGGLIAYFLSIITAYRTRRITY